MSGDGLSGEEARLRVKSRGKILGPMTIFDVANLLAEGQLAETDHVSEAGGPWISVEQYVLRQSSPEGAPPASDEDALFGDDFAIEFDLGAADDLEPIPAPAVPPSARGRPRQKNAPPATGKRKPLAPLADDDEILNLDDIPESPPFVEVLDDAEDADEVDSGTYRLSGRGAPPSRSASPRRLLPPRSDEASPRRLPSRSDEATPRRPVKRRGSSDSEEERPDEDHLMDAMRALARDEGATAPTGVLRRQTGDSSASPISPALSGRSTVGLPPAVPKGLHADSRPLFNGRSLAGWEFLRTSEDAEGDEDAWSVSGGVLRFDGGARQIHLVSVADFADFELWLAWRALEPDAQGGLFLRSEARDGGSRSWISLSERDAGRMLGAGVSGSAAVPALQNPPGEWNVWRVVAIGTRVGLWCNRQCAWSTAKLDRPRGRIGLRADGCPFEYRFLHIRSLKRK